MPDASAARLVRALRRCPLAGVRLSRGRVALTLTMPVALFRRFVRWRRRSRRRFYVERPRR